MATKYLDDTGLAYFWGKIKSYVASLLSSKADDSAVVHKTGAETVGGIKTFTAKPVLNQVGLDMTVKDTTEGSTTTRTDTVLKAISTNAIYGINAMFGAGGGTIVGAGEGKNSQLLELAGTSGESVYFVADSNIYFKSNANTYANAKVITYNTDGHLDYENPNITRGTNPSSNVERALRWNDSAGNRLGVISNAYKTNGSSETSLYAYKTTVATGGNIGRLGIGCDSSGNLYTVAPTPAVADDSTKIATTAWCRTATGNFACNAATVTGTAGTSALSWNTEITLYTVGGHAIKAKLPANPNTNTTYTFATGDNNGQIKVTPSGGSAQNVSVKGLGTAAYTASTAYAASSHTHGHLTADGNFVRDSSVSGADLFTITYYGTARGSLSLTSTYLGLIDSLQIYLKGGDEILRIMNNYIRPESNETCYLGNSSHKFSAVYAKTGTIQTSDERLKTPFVSVPDKVLDAWGDVGWGEFKYLSSIDRKGGDARLHLGLIAQRVAECFAARGLDACAYGILCYDADEDLWMVRYTEALAMEAAYQRRRADRFEARLAALEAKLP